MLTSRKVSLCFIVVSLLCANSQADKLRGFVNQVQETGQELCTTTGTIPSYLSGFFLRQLCGAVGPMKDKPNYKIDHVMDCIGMVGAYEFSGGQVFYANKYYPTHPYEAWNNTCRGRSSCNVAWNTAFSEIDQRAYDENRVLRSGTTNSQTGVQMNPNIAFWRIGSRIQAVEEAQIGFEFTPDKLEMKGLFDFSDTNFGFSSQLQYISNAPHEQMEEDGTVWSTVMAFEPSGNSGYKLHRIIYKIDPRYGNRTVVGDRISAIFTISTAQSICTQAQGKYIYRGDINAIKSGYVHSFGMTKNYIILPISSYLFNPCYLLKEAHNKPGPVFKDYFFFVQSSPATFLVMRKSDGNFVREFTASQPPQPYFFTHTVNAFEDEAGNINMDILTYKTSRVWTEYTSLKTLTSVGDEWPTAAALNRFNLNMQNGVASSKELTTAKILGSEYPQINKASSGKDYRFTYMVNYPFSEASEIIKYDVKNKDIKTWKATNIYPSEPIFVAEPGKSEEDAGVLLVGSFNSTSEKGLVIILDAQKMTEVGRVEAPGLTPYGLHNRFFSNEELGRSGSEKFIAKMWLLFFMLVPMKILFP